jgi:hypothetical protein
MGWFVMFTPAISAILVQKLIYKEPLKEPLGISFKLNRWFLEIISYYWTYLGYMARPIYSPGA